MPILLPPAIDPLRDVHGAQIAAHLPDRDGASVKLPANITYVFIVFTNRSGSTFLGDLLAASGFFNFAEELLNHQQVLQVCATKGWRSFSQYFTRMAAAKARNGHFVVKSSVGQLAVLADHGLLERILPQSRFLVTERLDKVAQAVSWAIANQTGRFTSLAPDSRSPAPVYDGVALRGHVVHFHGDQANINQFMTLNGLLPFHITYETLAAQPELAARLAFDFLGQPGLRADLSKIRLERQATTVNAEWRARFLAEQALESHPARANVTAGTVYRRIKLPELAADTSAVVGGRPIAEPIALLGPAMLNVPGLAFGDTALDREGLSFDPPGDPGARRLERGTTPAYLLRDVMVHGKYGVVTAGDRVIRETLANLPLHRVPGATRLDDLCWRLPDFPQSAVLHTAYHLLAGSQENYSHWLLDIAARFHAGALQTLREHPESSGAPVLLTPVLDVFWKWESLGLLVPPAVPRIALTAEGRVFVQRLLLVPDVTGGAFNSHPAILEAFDAIRAAAFGGNPPQAPWRRLYIARRDSQKRVLINEAEVIARAERAGFTCVTLSKLPVSEQVRLFAEASHVLAPHGAGLANLLFCKPDARVLELHMDMHVSWIYRRIAALRALRYGCLIGRAVQPARKALHTNTWEVDLDRLDAALADVRFAGRSAAELADPG